MYGKSVEGQQIWIAPTCGTDNEYMLADIRRECFARLQEPESGPLDSAWK
jgi:hypothetical protein